MKYFFLSVILLLSISAKSQKDDRLTTLDFVTIVNGAYDEAIYYYQNNWKVLREMALKKEFIASYQILETPFSEDAPFQLILVTTYPNKTMYEQREKHFEELIKERGPLKLLNDLRPGDFRKFAFSKEEVKHLYAGS